MECKACLANTFSGKGSHALAWKKPLDASRPITAGAVIAAFPRRSMGTIKGDILEWDIPKAKMKLLQAWIELHKDELMADWRLAVEGQQTYKIEPLR